MTKFRRLHLIPPPTHSTQAEPSADPLDAETTEALIRHHIDALQVLALTKPRKMLAILRLTDQLAYPRRNRRASHGR